jgi:hypothetical protein
LLPPPAVIAVVGANEVVVGAGGAVIVGAEEDEEEEEGEEDGDENGDEGVVVAPAVVAVFCVKSIVRRTGWHISAAVGVPASIADAHNSKLLTLAGIVTLIGRLIGGACSFPRIRLTSMPIFLVERLLLLLLAVPPSGSPASAPSSPILNVNVIGLDVLPPLVVVVALWSVVVLIVVVSVVC